jgi:hypothetical protein
MQGHGEIWGNLSLGLKALNELLTFVLLIKHIKRVSENAGHTDILGVGKCMNQLCCAHDCAFVM